MEKKSCASEGTSAAVGDEFDNTSKIVNVTESLDRDKMLDEAIFLALCGLDHCRAGLEVTGVVRLEMAKHKLNAVIEKIYDKLNNKNSNQMKGYS